MSQPPIHLFLGPETQVEGGENSLQPHHEASHTVSVATKEGEDEATTAQEGSERSGDAASKPKQAKLDSASQLQEDTATRSEAGRVAAGELNTTTPPLEVIAAVMQQLGWNVPQTSSLPPIPKVGQGPGQGSSRATVLEAAGSRDPWDDTDSLTPPKGEEEEEPEDWLAAYASQKPQGPPLSEKAAELIASALVSKLPEDRDKALGERYLTPANAGLLIPPKPNALVWEGLRKSTQITDQHLMRAHAYLLRGLIPTLQVLQELGGKANKEHRHRLLDAVYLLAAGAHTLTVTRRAAMAPDLLPLFRALCAVDKPFGEWLFGPNELLEKTIKTLQEAKASEVKLGMAAAQPKAPKRDFKGKTHNWSKPAASKKTGPFLGGKGSFRRKKGPPHKAGPPPTKGKGQPQQQQQ